jgi:chromosome segregation ATPase
MRCIAGSLQPAFGEKCRAVEAAKKELEMFERAVSLAWKDGLAEWRNSSIIETRNELSSAESECEKLRMQIESIEAGSPQGVASTESMRRSLNAMTINCAKIRENLHKKNRKILANQKASLGDDCNSRFSRGFYELALADDECDRLAEKTKDVDSSNDSHCAKASPLSKLNAAREMHRAEVCKFFTEMEKEHDRVTKELDDVEEELSNETNNSVKCIDSRWSGAMFRWPHKIGKVRIFGQTP